MTNLELYINNLKNIHPNIVYQSGYVTTKTKALHICKICNSEIYKRPCDFLYGKQKGCLTCYNRNRFINKDEFESRLKETSWSLVKVPKKAKGLKAKVLVRNKYCGHLRVDEVRNLLRSDICRKCSSKGSMYNKPTTLYLIKIKGRNLFKIGITHRGIYDRYYSASDRELIEVLELHTFKNRFLAYEVEQKILKAYHRFKYSGSILLDSGNTEILKVKPKIKRYLKLDILV